MMYNLLAGIHIDNKPDEVLSLNVDFEKNVANLKEEIAGRIKFDAKNLELIYNGNALEDDLKLSDTITPNGMVHCFHKTKKVIPPKLANDGTRESSVDVVKELFNMIAHIQISVNSRVTILQKILNEYPEFRRNLGAQAFIRDSVLFNTLHQPEVIKNIMKTYPIIFEAAPFIVNTIKKELARTASSSFSEPATDSPTSSEEESSLGSSHYRGNESSSNQTENASVRAISRQQLQAALSQIGFGSHNSLSNIAQRNTDASVTSSGSVPLSTSASGERISTEMFRNELQRALNSLNERLPDSADNSQRMDTSETPANSSSTANLPETADTSGGLPPYLHSHQYVEQLRTMAQMGFLNHAENLTFLEITNGNIENAINLLMGSTN